MEKGEIAQAAVAVVMIIALILGRPVNMPDNVMNLHGLPMIWGSHQLMTIAGPVDTWTVSINTLVIDLVIWLALLMLTPVAVKYYYQRDK